MCLSVPARVLEVHDPQWATVDVGGTSKRISIDLVEGVQAGDYVLLHVGFALQKIDEAEAQSLLALFDEMVRAQEQALWSADADDAPRHAELAVEAEP